MTDSVQQVYERLYSHYLWQSRWYHVRQDQLRAPGGQEFTYTVIEKPDGVWVVPVTEAGDLVLIEQYRYPVGAWCLEVPAGNIEPGYNPADMAARELREEIGGAAARLEPAAQFYTMNGIGSERALVFVALGVTLGQPAHEPTEYIRLHLVTVEEGLRLAHTGAIQDGPSALAILLCEPQLRAYLVENQR